jgi:hypothetical protein
LGFGGRVGRDFVTVSGRPPWKISPIRFVEGPATEEDTMYRSTRIISAVAIVASALALAPAAYADPPYGDATSVGDTTGVGLMYASTVKGPTTADTTGAGILHASMVDAEVDRATLVRTESGFQWEDAGIGAAAGFAAALTALGAAAAIRSRRRVVA